MNNAYIAIDVGASSGRVVVCFKEGNKYQFKVVHRFGNYLKKKEKYLYWEIKEMFKEILKGIEIATKKYGNIKSIGIDTFGVDVVLLDNDNNMVIKPLSYRNNLGLISNLIVESKISKKALYSLTGIQYNHFNTLYQLVYFKEILKIKFKRALLLPDYFAYLLTGSLRTELTIFSSTNLMNAKTYQLIKESNLLGIDKDLFPKFISAGETYGYLKKEIKDELNLKEDIKVIAVCGHDTASAVKSIPENSNQLFLNSGTMGVLGALIDEPILTSKALEYNYSNELGHDNKVRLLKNTMGLWIQNEAIKAYLKINPSKSVEEVRKTVYKAKGVNSYINVDDDRFTAPNNMLEVINEYLIETNQQPLSDIGEIILCIYQSLALKYYFNIKEIEELTNTKYEEIYVTGGGSNIAVFLQQIANFTNKKVIKGETEATILGNLYVQLENDGIISSSKEGRELLKTRELEEFTPTRVDGYEAIIKKYHKMFYNKK